MPYIHFAYWEPKLIRYDPPVPRVGFGIAAVVMSAATFGLLVVLPAALEQDNSVLALHADSPRTAAAAHPTDLMHLRCTVPAAVNAPLFLSVPPSEPDPQCKHPS